MVTYILDDSARLIGVGGDWDRFALENGAPELVAPQPLGRPLRSFIADRTTARLYDEILARAKATRAPVTLSIRCDAPDVRRDLRLTIRYDGGCYRVASELVAATRRQAVPVVGAPPHPSQLCLSCSWCNRLAVNGEWTEVEYAVERLAIFQHDRLVELTHGVCDDCLERVEMLLSDDPGLLAASATGSMAAG